MELTLKVPNMVCQHCVMRIKAALIQEGLAESVTIDLAEQLVKVTTDADEAAICQRITALGYQVVKP